MIRCGLPGQPKGTVRNSLHQRVHNAKGARTSGVLLLCIGGSLQDGCDANAARALNRGAGTRCDGGARGMIRDGRGVRHGLNASLRGGHILIAR